MLKFTSTLSLLLVSLSALVCAEELNPTLGPNTAIVVEMANTLNLSDLTARLEKERLVYIGESHTEYGDHLMQLALIQALYRHNSKLAIGVEWFQKPFQKILDQYIVGEINEAEMLKQTDYFNRWRFDYRLYRPIIQFAKEKKIPLIALNASVELTNAIKKEGIKGISNELKKQLPESYDRSDKPYEERLKQIHDAHPNKTSEFEQFLDVQLTWDETMAEQAADFLNGNPEHRLAVLAGRGHLTSRSGIPNRVERRIGLKGSLILIQQMNVTDRSAADYILFAKRKMLKPAGLMGALLETKDEVIILDFSKTSSGKKAGLEKGDVIVDIDGNKISSYSELKLVMLNKLPGDEVEVTVRRKEKHHTYTFKLAARAMH